MPDPRFYRRAGPRTLADLAATTGARLVRGADAGRIVSDIARLEDATGEDIAYVAQPQYVAAWGASGCGACITTEALAGSAPASCAVLVGADPRAAFAAVAAAFYPPADTPVQTVPVDPGATIGKDVRLAPGVVVGPGAVIGDGARIGANTLVGPGVTVGAGAVIGPNVTLAYCLIGARAVIHAGVRIGQDGFGFVPTPGGLRKIPQLGRVVVHDDVEIGANTTIDRGALADTVIGAGTKIDNLVQIGHNVVMGRNCIVVAQVGISGSCTIGNGVVIGGQAGLAGHLTLADGVQVGAQSGLMRDVGRGEAVMGYPARPVRQFWREIAALSRLTRRNKGP